MNKPGFYILAALAVVVELFLLGQQFQARARLRAEKHALELPARRLTALAAENQRLTHDVSAATDAVSLSSSQWAELNRLRSEVADQQQQIQDLRARLAVQSTLPAFQSLSGSNRFVTLAKESWSSAGYSTPEAALESMLWATWHGDINRVRASLTPAELARRNNGIWKGKTDGEIADAGVQGLSQVSGIQILNLQMLSENEAHFTVYLSGLTQPDQPLWMDMKRVDGEWKSDASEHRLAAQ